MTQKNEFNLVKFLTKYAMVIALVVVFVLFSALTDGRLLQPQNMTNLMLQNGYVLVMACGMLLCILTGGNIDLSVGSVVCLVGGVAAVMVTNMGMPAIPVILLCLVLGLLVGVWQGYWIGYVRIPPFITTLGGMFIFRGIGRFVLNSKTVAVQDPTFLNIFTAYIKIPGLDDGDIKLSPIIVGVAAAAYIILNTVKSRRDRAKKGYRQNSALADFTKSGIIAALILWYCWMLSQYRGISVMLVWVVAICLIYNFITSKTAFGRYFYAVGGNNQSANMLGINVRRTKFLAHVLCSLLAGLGGILYFLHVGSGDVANGAGDEMNAIASSIIGGTLLTGGVGNVIGTFFGVLSLNTIKRIVSSLGFDEAWWSNITVAAMLCLFLVVQSVVLLRRNKSK